VHFVALAVAEQPEQQIEEVHADVHRDAAGLAVITLPGSLIPGAATRDVGQAQTCALARRIALELRLQLPEHRQQAQLQHGVDAASELLLELRERVEVPRVDRERLLADHVGV
jgi:hypothetical protein